MVDWPEAVTALPTGLASWKRTKTSFVVSCKRVLGLCSFRVAFDANWHSWYRFVTWASAPKIKSDRIFVSPSLLSLLSAVSNEAALCGNQRRAGQEAPGSSLDRVFWIGLSVFCLIRRVRQCYWSTFYFVARRDRADLSVRHPCCITQCLCFEYLRAVNPISNNFIDSP